MAIAQFSGLASGIDSKALINAVIESRELKNALRRKDIDFLESENDSLEELNTKLLSLSELIDKFRTVNGGGVNKKASSSDATVATATAGTGATESSHTINVVSRAKTATGSYDNSFSSPTSLVDPVGGGSVQVDVGFGPDLVSINVPTTTTTTLEEVVNAINTNPLAEGRVVASAINIGNVTADYRLVVNTVKEGLRLGQLALTSTASNLTDPATVDQADVARIQINGINGTIVRESNAVSDIISGLSFQLNGTGTATITVGSDASSTTDDMSEIVDAYNDIVKFINENDLVERIESDRDSKNIFGTLAKTRVDNDFLAGFRTALLAASSSGDEATSMPALGISTNRDGTLTFDADKFNTTASADPSGATDVLRDFADRVSGVSGVIFQFTRFQGFIDIAQGGNNSEIEGLNSTIQQLERQTAKIREGLEKQFARLEKTVGGLQSQQQALTGILAGLG